MVLGKHNNVYSGRMRRPNVISCGKGFPILFSLNFPSNSVSMHLLNGAVPLVSCPGGASVRLAPLQATREMMFLPGMRI